MNNGHGHLFRTGAADNAKRCYLEPPAWRGFAEDGHSTNTGTGRLFVRLLALACAAPTPALRATRATVTRTSGAQPPGGA